MPMVGISYYISKKILAKLNMENKGQKYTIDFSNFLVLTSKINYGNI